MKKAIAVSFVLSGLLTACAAANSTPERLPSSSVTDKNRKEHVQPSDENDNRNWLMKLFKGYYNTRNPVAKHFQKTTEDDIHDTLVIDFMKNATRQRSGVGLNKYSTKPDQKPQPKVRYFRYGSITLASRQPAILYRNGKPILEITSISGGYKFINDIKLYYGDVLAVESTKRLNGPYGVAVDVRVQVKAHNGRRTTYVHYNTETMGNARTWRGDGEFRGNWEESKEGYCNLPRPTAVENGIVRQSTDNEAPPMSESTRYVWVCNGGTYTDCETSVPETAYLLLVVGVRCEDPLGFKSDTPFSGGHAKGGNHDGGSGWGHEKGQKDMGKSSGYVDGLIDEYPAECKCRALPVDDRSACYDMSTKMASGRCTKRRCGTKYECVPGGGKGLRVCMRRVSRSETVLRSDYGGVLFCDVRLLEKPKVFYTLYQ